MTQRTSLLASVALAGIVAWPTVSLAEDTDQTRFYLSARLGKTLLPETRPMTGLEVESSQQVTGVSVGVNLGRHVGVELAGDAFEPDLRRSNGQKIGELGMFTLIPQVRLRYPLLDGRLTPYVIGGVGIGLVEFNDRNLQAAGKSPLPGVPAPPRVTIRTADDPGVVGALGAGVEYFVANNIAVGLESRYVVARDQEITLEGRTERATLDALLTTLSLRLLFPESPRAAAARGPEVETAGRLYLGLRAGGAVPRESRVVPGLNAKPENAAIADTFNQLYGFSVGLDLTRYVGVEVAGDGFELMLETPGIGSQTEYAIYVVAPQVRIRYPLLQGRLVPYALGGVGVSYGETNDRKPHAGFQRQLEAKNYSVAGVLGAGLEYFVAGNIAVGAEAKYLVSRGHTFSIDGRKESAHLDSILATFGVRIYFGEGVWRN